MTTKEATCSERISSQLANEEEALKEIYGLIDDGRDEGGVEGEDKGEEERGGEKEERKDKRKIENEGMRRRVEYVL